MALIIVSGYELGVRSNALGFGEPIAREIEREKHQQEQIECFPHRCSAIETRTAPGRWSTSSLLARPRYRGCSAPPFSPPPPPAQTGARKSPRYTGKRKSRSSCCTGRIYPQGSCRIARKSCHASNYRLAVSSVAVNSLLFSRVFVSLYRFSDLSLRTLSSYVIFKRWMRNDGTQPRSLSSKRSTNFLFHLEIRFFLLATIFVVLKRLVQ